MGSLVDEVDPVEAGGEFRQARQHGLALRLGQQRIKIVGDADPERQKFRDASLAEAVQRGEAGEVADHDGL